MSESTRSRIYCAAYAAHSNQVLLYCRRFAESWDAAEDLAHDTWTKAWLQLSAYRSEGAFMAWVMRIARTVCTRSAVERARHRLEPLWEDVPNPDQAEAFEAVELQDREDRQLSLFMGLPLRQRQVVLLRLAGGHSTESAAKLLGCRPGTIKATLHHARRARRAAAAQTRRTHHREPPAIIDDLDGRLSDSCRHSGAR